MNRYYSKEMGPEEKLSRFIFLSFAQAPREELVANKAWAQEQEKNHLVHGKRMVNIDVGYVSAENVILATTKNFLHRIYVGGGVFADLTLVFAKGVASPLEWSYKDYSSDEALDFFNLARSFLMQRDKM
jgi:CYTH domain-containing protein